MTVLDRLDLFGPSTKGLVHFFLVRPNRTALEPFVRAVRALRRDLGERDSAKSAAARTDMNVRVLRSVDALAAAARRLAAGHESVAAELYALVFEGLSEAERLRYLASAESVTGWEALASVETALARAYAAPNQLLARLALMQSA